MCYLWGMKSTNTRVDRIFQKIRTGRAKASGFIKAVCLLVFWLTALFLVGRFIYTIFTLGFFTALVQFFFLFGGLLLLLTAFVRLFGSDSNKDEDSKERVCITIRNVRIKNGCIRFSSKE